MVGNWYFISWASMSVVENTGTMAEKIIISKKSISKAIDIFVTIILFFAFGYFVKDVFEKFQAKDTSFSQNVKKYDQIHAPTFSICFNPPLKKKIVEQYNLSYSVVRNFGFGNSNIIDSSYTIPQIFKESSYQLDKDFTLKALDYSCGEVIVTCDAKIIHEGKNDIITPNHTTGQIFVEILSSMPYGLCYALTPDYKLGADDTQMYR